MVKEFMITTDSTKNTKEFSSKDNFFGNKLKQKMVNHKIREKTVSAIKTNLSFSLFSMTKRMKFN